MVLSYGSRLRIDLSESPSGWPFVLVYGYARFVSEAASKRNIAAPWNVWKLGMSAVAMIP